MQEEPKPKQKGAYDWKRETTRYSPEFKTFNKKIAPAVRDGKFISLHCVWDGRLRICGVPDKWGKIPERGLTIGRLIRRKGTITQYNKEVLKSDIEMSRGVQKIAFNHYVIENLNPNSLVCIKLYENKSKTRYSFHWLTAGEVLEKGSDDIVWKGKGHEKKLMVRVDDLKPLVMKWLG